MKKLLSTLLVVAAINSYSDTQEKVAEMRKGYRKEALSEVTAIQKEYQAKLETALKKAEKFNYTEDAEFLREEMEALKDPAYLLQEDDTGVKQFQGEWLVTYQGGLNRVTKIDRFGNVKTKDAKQADGSPWPDGGFKGKIKYDPEAKLWVCLHELSEDRTLAVAYEIKDGKLYAKQWNGFSFKYPESRYATGIGVRL